MNDREFIELLNLYVDKEISPEDALRLEAEVGANPARRKVYDQYCKMHRACCLLADELAQTANARSGSFGAELRAPLASRMAPYMVGLAAAACLVALVGLRDRGTAGAKGSAAPAVETAARPAMDAVEIAQVSEPMTAVFSARLASSQAESSGARVFFAVDEAPSQLPQLNWMQDIHMPPVRPAAASGLLLGGRPDLGTPIPNTVQGGRDSQGPAELTAFRFQR